VDILEEMGQGASSAGATAPTLSMSGMNAEKASRNASNKQQNNTVIDVAEPIDVVVAQGGGRRRRGRKGRKSHKGSRSAHHKKSHKRSTHRRKSRRQH
jgi:hypothetical protein